MVDTFFYKNLYTSHHRQDISYFINQNEKSKKLKKKGRKDTTSSLWDWHEDMLLKNMSNAN